MSPCKCECKKENSLGYEESRLRAGFILTLLVLFLLGKFISYLFGWFQ